MEHMISSVVKNSWNWYFAAFRDLTLFFIRNFIKKETLAQGFSCEFWKIFQNTIFTEHLCMASFILQQLLGLYFAIIYSWQLSSSEKSLSRKKLIHISHGFYRFLLRGYLKNFFLANVCLPCRLRKASRSNHFVGSETLKRNTFDLVDENFSKFQLHLEYFPRNTWFLSFHGINSFLVFTELIVS